MSGGRGRGFVAGALGWLQLACAGWGISDAELPAAPIAIHYRTPTEARQRAALLEEELRAAGGASWTTRRAAGVADLGEMQAMFRRLWGGKPERGTSAGRLMLLDPRTRTLRAVAGARRGAIPLDWSADRQRLLFAQPEGRVFQLWELRIADGRIHPLTRGAVSHLQGCYADEGRLVAVAARQREGGGVHSSIVRSAPEGSGPWQPVSEGPADHSPACGAGGSVAWVAEAAPGRPEVILATRGAPARRLAPGRDPIYAPGSLWLVFSGPLGREWKLWRIRPQGGGRVRIGRGGLSEFHPSISPDGRFIAYVASEEVPKRQLYLRRFDGSGDRVLFSDGDVEHPVW